MTNEEAINVLRNAAWLGTNEQREEVEQAVEVATKALQKRHSHDCISRQAAIDLVKSRSYDLSEREDEWAMVHDVEELPSVQPEQRKGKWIDFSMSIKGVPTEACGECGEWSLGMGKNFCPNCGAKMGEKT